MQLKIRTIVVGLDFSELGDRAFRHAYDLALSSPTSELHAVFVMPQPPTGQETSEADARARFDEGLARLSKHVNTLLGGLGGLCQSSVRVYSHARIDVALVGIIQLAAELQAHFIVLGSHRRPGWQIGSVAEGVVRNAPCPVVVIPPELGMPELPRVAVACSICVQARKDSKGRQLWCTAHNQHRSRRHMYHQRERLSEAVPPSVR
jgi:nucleotide-binding universal stress UspA family protein